MYEMVQENVCNFFLHLLKSEFGEQFWVKKFTPLPSFHTRVPPEQQFTAAAHSLFPVNDLIVTNWIVIN